MQEDNTEMNLKGYEGVDWIQVIHNKEKGPVLRF